MVTIAQVTTTMDTEDMDSRVSKPPPTMLTVDEDERSVKQRMNCNTLGPRDRQGGGGGGDAEGLQRKRKRKKRRRTSLSA